MWEGRLVSIHIAPKGGQPVQTVTEVEAVPGRGLKGDRYFFGCGTWSSRGTGEDRQVTLIALETVEALQREAGISLEPSQFRRNLVTIGVPLNQLVGVLFSIGGSVVLRGIRLCEPCQYLSELTDPRILTLLVHRGGLRAEIVTGGILRSGDVIKPC